MRVNRSHPHARGLIAALAARPSSGSVIPDAIGPFPAELQQSTAYEPGPAWMRRPVKNFAGTTDYAVVRGLGSVVLTNDPGFAISGWFRPDVIDSNWKTVCSKQASGNRQFFVGLNGGYSAPTNGLSLFTNDGAEGAVGTVALTTGRWYWFLASHYGTGAGGNAIWAWSEEDGFLTGSAGTAGPSNTTINSDGGTNPVVLSRFTDAEPRGMQGAIGPMFFWNRALHSELDARSILAEARTGYRNLLVTPSHRRLFGVTSGGPTFLPAWAARSQNLGVGVY